MKAAKTNQTKQISSLKKALVFANSIVNTVREPLVVLYPGLTIYSVNTSFYKVFKTTEVETIGKELYDLGDGQWNIPLLRKLITDVLGSRKTFRDFEVEHDFKKIGCKTMLLNGRKIPVTHFNDHMTLLAIEDITEKKALEKKIEGEKNILSENLRLLELTKQKDDFFYMASHELKTPVTILKVYMNLLETEFTEDVSSNASEMIVKMNEQIRKLTRRINDLLDTAKMEGGKLQYNLTYFDFNELIIQSVKEIQLTTNQHIIELNLTKTVTLFADKERIEQVIVNLVNNAIKFSPKAKTVIVSTISNTTDVILSVKDFGIGMLAKNQNRIFERFFRVKGSVEDTFPGLGLGLFLASEIINRHKGKFNVKSTQGKGTVFTLNLPYVDNYVPLPITE